MKTSLSTTRVRGFTLIELLTVIAIIGILAAIIIPTVGKVRDSARRTQSLSNLRQWGTALHLYVSDNAGRMPLRGPADRPSWAQVSTDTPIAREAWYNVLPPYVSERALYELVTNEQRASLFSDTSMHRDPKAEFTESRKAGNPAFSYTYNSQLNTSRSGGDALSNNVRQSFSAFSSPSNTVFVFETRSNANDGAPGFTQDQTDNQAGRAYGHSRHVSFRYGGKVGITFLDGSVRSYDSASIFRGTEVNNDVVFFSGLE